MSTCTLEVEGRNHHLQENLAKKSTKIYDSKSGLHSEVLLTQGSEQRIKAGQCIPMF